MQVSGFICEGPRCKKGANGTRMVVQWSPQLVEIDENAMPDQFFRFIVAQPVYEAPSPTDKQGRQPVARQFCSKDCLRDYFGQDYVEPLSPRESAAIAANNVAVEKQRAEELESRKPATPKIIVTDEAITNGGNA